MTTDSLNSNISITYKDIEFNSFLDLKNIQSYFKQQIHELNIFIGDGDKRIYRICRHNFLIFFKIPIPPYLKKIWSLSLFI